MTEKPTVELIAGQLRAHSYDGHVCLLARMDRGKQTFWYPTITAFPIQWLDPEQPLRTVIAHHPRLSWNWRFVLGGGLREMLVEPLHTREAVLRQMARGTSRRIIQAEHADAPAYWDDYAPYRQQIIGAGA